MTIAVTGATGQLRHLNVEKLKEKVAVTDVVVLVRSPEKAVDLGVAAVAFDYGQPGRPAPALVGTDRLLLISSNEIGSLRRSIATSLPLPRRTNRASPHANLHPALITAG